MKATTSRSIAPSPVGEALLQARGDRLLVAAGRDLAHDGRAGRIEREDLLGARLEQHAAEFLLAELDEFGQSHGHRISGPPLAAAWVFDINTIGKSYRRDGRLPIPGRLHFQPLAAILRRMNAIWVDSGRFFGQTSWQASSDMQPKTPSSSPITS